MNSLADTFQQKLTLEEEEDEEEKKEETKEPQKMPSPSKAASSYLIRDEIDRDTSTDLRFNKKKYQSSCKMSSAQADAKQKKNLLLSEGITEMVKNKKTTQVLQNEIMTASSTAIDTVISRVYSMIRFKAIFKVFYFINMETIFLVYLYRYQPLFKGPLYFGLFAHPS
jgi:IS30 family transposase